MTDRREMDAIRIVCLATAWLLAFSTSACGGDTLLQTDITTMRSAPATTPPETTAPATPKQPPPVALGDFDGDLFDQSTKIENEWYPVTPGTQFVYEGKVTEDTGRVNHRVVFTVTDLTKVIDGVRTVVVWDVDYTAGEVVETELAFFAQDNDGNVWLLGEYPEEWEDGEFVGAPDTWFSGLEEARAGILMRVGPALGQPSYFQGWAPAIEFADRAQVLAIGEETCVPFDCYENVLVTEEWNPDEPGAFQRKFYAKGVGQVRVGWAGVDEQQESLALVSVKRLSPRELTTAREQALQLEMRAYKARADLYGLTPSAEVATGG